MPAWQALRNEAKADVQRLQIDRLQALAVRIRSLVVVSSYEALLVQGVQIPPYALRHVAASYLALKQPEKARDLYKQVLAAEVSQIGRASCRERVCQYV